MKAYISVLFPSAALLFSILWWTLLLVVWWIFRPRILVWSWNLLVTRWGNPAGLIQRLRIPSMAGDMSTFLNYQHFLSDLKESVKRDDRHMMGVKILFFLVTEILAFSRIFTVMIFLRNLGILFCLNFYFDEVSFQGDKSGFVILAAFLLMDLLNAGYILWHPEALIPDRLEYWVAIHGVFLLKILILNILEDFLDYLKDINESKIF